MWTIVCDHTPEYMSIWTWDVSLTNCTIFTSHSRDLPILAVTIPRGYRAADRSCLAHQTRGVRFALRPVLLGSHSSFDSRL